MNMNDSINKYLPANLCDEFEIYGKKKIDLENTIENMNEEKSLFGLINIYLEFTNSKIKLNTVFEPTEYAKKWVHNNKARLGSLLHKPVHKYKHQYIFQTYNKELSIDDFLNKLNTQIDIIKIIKKHLRDIISKIGSRTNKEYDFSVNEK